MSIDAMKQALEALEETESALVRCMGPHKAEEGDRHRALAKSRTTITTLRLAIEQAERQEPLVNIELSRRMAAVKVSNFYASIIKDAEKEIERLHGLVLQHKAAVAAEREACAKVCEARYMGDNNREDAEARRCAAAIRARI
jgi:hypothetical protein